MMEGPISDDNVRLSLDVDAQNTRHNLDDDVHNTAHTLIRLLPSSHYMNCSILFSGILLFLVGGLGVTSTAGNNGMVPAAVPEPTTVTTTVTSVPSESSEHRDIAEHSNSISISPLVSDTEVKLSPTVLTFHAVLCTVGFIFLCAAYIFDAIPAHYFEVCTRDNPGCLCGHPWYWRKHVMHTILLLIGIFFLLGGITVIPYYQGTVNTISSVKSTVTISFTGLQSASKSLFDGKLTLSSSDTPCYIDDTVGVFHIIVGILCMILLVFVALPNAFLHWDSRNAWILCFSTVVFSVMSGPWAWNLGMQSSPVFSHKISITGCGLIIGIFVRGARRKAQALQRYNINGSNRRLRQPGGPGEPLTVRVGEGSGRNQGITISNGPGRRTSRDRVRLSSGRARLSSHEIRQYRGVMREALTHPLLLSDEETASKHNDSEDLPL